MTHLIASRVVDWNEHRRFAALSGDYNPMHMDPVAARRTQAGAPVVHGMHTLLWALDSLAGKGHLDPGVSQIRAKFLKWTFPGDEARLFLAQPGPGEDMRFHVEVNGLTVLTGALAFGPRVAEAHASKAQKMEVPEPRLDRPRELGFEDFNGLTGQVLVPPGQQATSAFPALARTVGAGAVGELAACSYVIGMEAPGLHSMFSKIDVRLIGSSEPSSGLDFEVVSADERFRKLRVAVNGSSLHGQLEAFVRVPPVRQASMELISRYVSPGEFASVRALVIGGSRGLGELTSKLIAAGGGDVTLTYASGSAEAQAIAGEIHSAGKSASVLTYDVRKAASQQLGHWEQTPTHLFYFATQTIYRPKAGLLSSSLLGEFLQFYVQGFYDLCVTLSERVRGEDRESTLGVLYPSTVFINERPAGMTEYAMAKAAGEQLCADMNVHMPGVRILSHRFPKLPTDQTAGVLPERETDALEAMLPVLRSLIAAGR